MEPLAHTLTGAALARTGLGRGTRLAGTALMLGANLPDVDVLSFLRGPDAALGFRRGLTHGPLGLLLLPPVLVALLAGWSRLVGPRADAPPFRSGRVLALAYLGCLTHPLLDWLNNYGVRLLSPFDWRWLYGDALFIVDPWLWLILGGAAYLARERRGVPWIWGGLALATGWAVWSNPGLVPLGVRVAWTVGLVAVAALRRLPATRRAALPGLGLAAVYIFALVALSVYGRGFVRAELERRGIAVDRLMVGPVATTPLRWEVVAETAADYRYGSLRYEPRPRLDLSGERIPRPRPSPVLDAALAAPEIRGAVGWMRFPFAVVEESASGYDVRLIDARYRRTILPRREGFGQAEVRLDRGLRVVHGRE